MKTLPVSNTPLQAQLQTLQKFQPFETTNKADLPFVKLMQETLQNVDAQQQLSAQNVDQVANGQAENLQGIAVQMAKADLSFRLLMEVRNKVIASYQEVMRMQI